MQSTLGSFGLKQNLPVDAAKLRGLHVSACSPGGVFTEQMLAFTDISHDNDAHK